jgi:hypothetical protein
VGTVVYIVFACFVLLVPVGHVVRHTFFAPTPGGEAEVPYPNCREGLSALYRAVVRARDATRRGLEEAQSDEQAVRLFRATVEPEWSHRDQVVQLCAPSAADRHALDTIERLRYAEEHAVRSQAAELQLLRRRARELVGIGP